MTGFARSGLFRRYFLLLMANLLFFLAALGCLIYFVFLRSFLNTQFLRSTVNGLAAVSRSVEYFVQKTDDVAKYYSLLDRESIGYSYKTLTYDSAFYTFLQRVRTQLLTDEYIHSIYLYYPLQRTLIDVVFSGIYTVFPDDGIPTPAGRKGTFYDTAWLPVVQARGFNAYGNILLPTRPVYVRWDSDTDFTFDRTLINRVKNDRVITVIRAFENRVSDPRGFVVANLNERVVRKYLANAYPDSPQVSFIVTSRGQIVSSDEAARAAPAPDLIRTILAQKPSQGFLTWRGAGGRTAVIYLRSSYLDWTYATAVPYSYIVQGLNSLTRTIIIVIVLVMTASTACLYVLSRQTYAPIEKVFTKIRSIPASAKHDLPPGDLRMIDSLLDDIHSNYAHLGKLLYDNFYVLKYSFLNQLLSGEIENAAQEWGFAEYRVRFDHAHFTVATIVIDGMSELLRDHRPQELFVTKQAVIDMAERMLGDQAVVAGTNIDQSHIALIINTDEPADPPALETRLRDVLKMAAQLFAASMSVGIGSSYPSMEGLRRSYDESLLALQHRIHRGKGAVVFYGELRTTGVPHAADMSGLAEQLVNHLRFGQTDRCLACLRTMIAEMKAKGLDRAEVESAFLEIAVLLHKHLNVTGSRFDDVCGIGIAQLLTDIAAFETIDDLEEELTPVFARVGGFFSENKRNHNSTVIAKVLGYLEKHYHEDISLHGVADSLGMSPQYTSRLIKEVSGINFLEYLTNVRMQKAEDFLVNTNLSVAEVAERIGYSTYRTFLMHFRARTGMIPTQYRKMKSSIVSS
jgi:AraC-like DNA-binding protein